MDGMVETLNDGPYLDDSQRGEDPIDMSEYQAHYHEELIKQLYTRPYISGRRMP